MNITVAILYGGASREHDVSVMGYEYVKELLTDTGYTLLPIYIDRSGEWTVKKDGKEFLAHPMPNSRGFLYTEYGFIKIDAAIPLLHGDGGEDGSVQGALECCGIKYVGARVAESAVCLDKFYTKCVATSLGIPTVDHAVFSGQTDKDVALGICKAKLGFPVFIKPRRLGSSVGAFPAYGEEDFLDKFPRSMELGDNLVIVERLIENKRELECAFAEIDGQITVTPPAEVLINGFYGYSEKYGGTTPTDAEASIDEKTKATVIDYSKRLADALGLRHLGRIDFFLAEDGIFFNEVNTFPGFTGESLYPKMLTRHGISPRRALLSFIEDAIK